MQFYERSNVIINGSFSFSESKYTQCIAVELIWQSLDSLHPKNIIGQFKQKPSKVVKKS